MRVLEVGDDLWLKFGVGNIFWMLVPNAYVKKVHVDYQDGQNRHQYLILNPILMYSGGG